jgi:hypothetical protein
MSEVDLQQRRHPPPQFRYHLGVEPGVLLQPEVYAPNGVRCGEDGGEVVAPVGDGLGQGSMEAVAEIDFVGVQAD